MSICPMKEKDQIRQRERLIEQTHLNQQHANRSMRGLVNKCVYVLMCRKKNPFKKKSICTCPFDAPMYIHTTVMDVYIYMYIYIYIYIAYHIPRCFAFTSIDLVFFDSLCLELHFVLFLLFVRLFGCFASLYILYSCMSQSQIVDLFILLRDISPT